MGTFLQKDELYSEAERLGVDLTGLKWAQMQSAVLKAKQAEGENIHYTDQKTQLKKQERLQNKPVSIPNETYIISVEVPARKYQMVHYDEPLAEDLDTEEISLDIGSNIGSSGYTTKTYKTKGRGKRVIASASAPKINCGIEYNPARDWVPRTIYQGRVGYIYSHPELPNIKSLLKQTGYFSDYEAELGDKSPYLWYAAGKILTIDINKTHQIFREISAKAKRDMGIS